MLREDDIFYDARLVSEARLHLGSIINGQYSEPFFVAMCKIINRKTYLGYKTLRGIDVKMGGIFDFMFNFHHGLGMNKRNISTFLANCAKFAIQDKTQSKYAYRTVEWIRKQDARLDFPQSYSEYLRLSHSIKRSPRIARRQKSVMLHNLKKLYVMYPHLLEDIGPGRKFKDPVECCDHYSLRSQPQAVRPVTVFKDPSRAAIQKLARDLHDRLTDSGRRLLIANMITLYKIEQQARKELQASDDSTFQEF